MNRAERRAQGLVSENAELRAQKKREKLQSDYSTLGICCGECNEEVPVPFVVLQNAFDLTKALRFVGWEVGETEGEFPNTKHYVPFCPACKQSNVETDEEPILHDDSTPSATTFSEE
mgnify:CR=1 FL=1